MRVTENSNGKQEQYNLKKSSTDCGDDSDYQYGDGDYNSTY